MPLTIEQRLQRLEGLIGTDSEALVPNNYSVDSSGNVNLSGINLPAGTNKTPPSQDRIRWIRQSDGAVVADIFGYSQGGVNVLGLNSYTPPGDTSHFISLLGLTGLGSDGTSIFPRYSNASGFATRIMWGSISALGNIENGSEDFIVGGSNPYLITFNFNFDNAFYVVAKGLSGTTGGTITHSNRTTGSVTITTFNAANVQTALSFGFIIIGTKAGI